MPLGDTKQKAGSTGAPAAPSAPPVPAIRNTTGVAAAARKPTTQQALRTGKLAQRRVAANRSNGTGTTTPPGTPKAPNFTNDQKQTLGQLSNEFKDFAENGVGTPNNATVAGQVMANPYNGEKMDPRDENYWANRQALEASYFADMALIERDQLDDNIETNMTAMELAEYNRRRKRDMGEARLGTGAAYTGQARRDQTENDTDFMTDMMRRDRQKARRDFDRDLERGRLTAKRDSDIRELELVSAKDKADNMVDESINSSGDATPVDKNNDGVPDTPGTGENNKPGQADKNKQKQQQIRKQMARITNQIEKLRTQASKAKDPKKKKQLFNQIQQLQKRRTQLQGQLGKLS